MVELFPGFESRRVETAGAEIHCVGGGSGPPLLLLHGNPQTHAMWYRIAPKLAADFTVVGSDLRGYGDSSKPDGGPDHAGYSKRAMAADQVKVMRARIGCPLLALWGTKGVVNRSFDPARDWSGAATDVRGKSLVPGHFLAEEAPRQRWRNFVPSSGPERAIAESPAPGRTAAGGSALL